MTGLTDFTDWLSPMLVKELRQGVRSRIFVYTLLLLQASLVLLTIIGLLASDAQRDSEGASTTFWVLTGVFLILFLPLGGLNAVSSERTSNTLELIFLTRLSSRRIIAGKWLAIVAQIVLLVFTILPYIVLRYFLGGVDLGWELLIVGGLLLASAVLSAVTVGLSPLPTILTRAVLVFGLFFGLYLLVIAMAFMAMGRGGFMGVSSFTVTRDGIAAALEGVFVMLLMLEFGAARIGPPAENHSSPLRLIALAAIAAGTIFDRVLFRGGGDQTFFGFCFALPVLIGALCESPRPIVSIYRPFVRRGIFGKIAGRFLYPGWPSATLYTLLVLLAFGVAAYFKGAAIHRTDSVLTAVIITGALLFPAAVIRFFGKRLRYPLATYIGVQAIAVLLYSLASVLADFKGQDMHPVLDAIPTCALLTIIFGRAHDPLLELSLVGTVTALSVIVLLFQSRRSWQAISILESKAKSLADHTGDSTRAETKASPAA